MNGLRVLVRENSPNNIYVDDIKQEDYIFYGVKEAFGHVEIILGRDYFWVSLTYPGKSFKNYTLAEIRQNVKL